MQCSLMSMIGVLLVLCKGNNCFICLFHKNPVYKCVRMTRNTYHLTGEHQTRRDQIDVVGMSLYETVNCITFKKHWPYL